MSQTDIGALKRGPYMDRDSMLHYASGHYAIHADPVRIQMPNGASAVSPPEGEVSSESTDDKASRLHVMSGSGHLHTATEDSSDSDPFAIAPGQEDNVISSHSKTQPVVRYRECMKNHAASLGGHALDGCGEFLPGGKDGLDSLMCAACSCHRNFHRKEVEGEQPCTCRVSFKPSSKMSGPSTPLLAIQTSRDLPSHGYMMMSMSSPEADLHSGSSSRKKRHRTKFSAEQKESMMAFADKLGWRLLKHDEDSVQAFCNEIGVPRSVFKVWMHNHKHSLTKRPNAGDTDLFSKVESPPEF